MSNKEFPAKETNNKEFTADCGHIYRWNVGAGCMACRCIEAEDELAIYKERDKAKQLVINKLEADIASLRTASQAVVDYLCVVHKFGTVVKP